MKKRSNLTGRSFSDGIELSKDGKHSLVVVTADGKFVRKHHKRNAKDIPHEDGKEVVDNILILVLLSIPIFRMEELADIMIYTAVAMILEVILLGITTSKEAKEYHAAEHMVMLEEISYVMLINIILYLSYSYKYIQIFMIKKPTEDKLYLALLALEELVEQK